VWLVPARWRQPTGLKIRTEKYNFLFIFLIYYKKIKKEKILWIIQNNAQNVKEFYLLIILDGKTKLMV